MSLNLLERCHCLGKRASVQKFNEADHVTAGVASEAVEEVFCRIDGEGCLVVIVEWALAEVVLACFFEGNVSGVAEGDQIH